MIHVENQSTIYIPRQNVKKYIKQIFVILKVNPKTDISIKFVDEKEMQSLHIKWMNLDGPTDVMSFPMDNLKLSSGKIGKAGLLGDIVICPQVALQDAIKANDNPAKHLVFLIVHGVLHLHGLDHQVRADKGIMQEYEQRIMKSLKAIK